MRRRDWMFRMMQGAALGGTALRSALAAPGSDASRPARASDPIAPAARARYPVVRAGELLRFPRDFGAHPDFRTEWWYITGWLRAAERDIGVQVTFFRSRTGHDERSPSRFAPTQLLFAHAALAVDGERRLRHAQRSARVGFGLASLTEGDTDVSIGDWRLQRTRDDRYLATIAAGDFGLELEFAPGSPPFAQGEAGYSRKGPRPEQASRYYSRPQLALTGRVRLATIRGEGDLEQDEQALQASAGDSVAWLDHEWSSELLDPRAAGWDWVGLNFDDGSALMAFRIRTREGEALWSHARWIPARTAGPAPAQPARLPAASAASADSAAERPRFVPLRQWRSARSGASYPVAMRVSVGARSLDLQPLFDDQELDTRASTGTIYWEGAVRVFEAGRAVGRGYLELTGYAGAIRL